MIHAAVNIYMYHKLFPMPDRKLITNSRNLAIQLHKVKPDQFHHQIKAQPLFCTSPKISQCNTISPGTLPIVVQPSGSQCLWQRQKIFVFFNILGV